MTISNSQLSISRIESDFSISVIENDIWNSGKEAEISLNWNGSQAPAGRYFSVTPLCSDTAIYFRFLATQDEPLVVSSEPLFDKKTVGLWERDVFEVFIATDKDEPNKYFEFEVAPTGEWLDLAIDSTSGERNTDWDYASGMETSAAIEENHVIIAMKIPWEAFGRKPKVGEVWLGNIFRCVGREPDRGYLAWRPTMTEKPNFHVPERFGEFEFTS
jgi:hypothetical protein